MSTEPEQNPETCYAFHTTLQILFLMMSSSADLVECELNALFNTLNYSIIYNFKKEDLGSYTLISVLGEVSEQITLSATTYLIQNY